MDWLNQHILSSLIFLPIVGAILLMLLPRRVSREGGIVVALLNFVLSLHLWRHWATGGGYNSAPTFRFEEMKEWLPQFGISYHLGVDGISLFLILLTTLLTPLLILFSWNSVTRRTKEFVICMLLLESAVIGTFSALDLILFYIFWEAVLIPTYLLIGVWGGPRRIYASIKFFVYTMAGSVLMWVAMLYLYFQQGAGRGSFDIRDITLAARNIDATRPEVAIWLFGAFALAFAIKAPLFPLHTWQPDAYSEAPTAGTVMLAAVLAKMGTYGFIRFAIPFFPFAAKSVAPLIIGLAIIGIIYGAMVAIKQTDYKKLLAYSSLSHMGFVVLGIFAALLTEKYGPIAMSGATIQMVNHGITTGALFLLVGAIYDRRQTRDINEFGGLAEVMPRFNVLFWIALFASIGLPGLNGFVGEYLILQGTMGVNFWYAAFATTGVILGAVYMLRLFRSLMFGEITKEENRSLKDVNGREGLVLVALLALAVVIGVVPKPFLDVINPDARKIVASSQPDATRNRSTNAEEIEKSKLVQLGTP